MKDAIGTACRRRSMRLRQQAHANELGARVGRSCSALLRPHVHASEVGAGAVHRRRDSFRATPLEDDDLLREILLRLPPEPSSLFQASAVCKQWRCAAVDPKFHRRFCAHHQKPPLLGFFTIMFGSIEFTPALDRPDRIATHIGNVRTHELLDCRHGLLLHTDQLGDEVIVTNLITGAARRLPFPPDYKSRNYCINAAVLCTASDRNHVHGSCHWNPFKVVLISEHVEAYRVMACVYSSETAKWSDSISTIVSCDLEGFRVFGSLVGNALYWLENSVSDHILEYDLDEQSLIVFNGPPVTNDFRHGSHWIIQAEDGVVGMAILSYPRFQMWQMNVNCNGVATWVMWKIMDMHNILRLPPWIEGKRAYVGHIVGCIEDTDGILLSVDDIVYMVQLKSMQSMKLCQDCRYSY
ncbi:uncharacterized protein [Triticum aestivum]|uniref:uncharacterized protein n=1 Tax=Triticum aestivum TaxID=4565 RepID=UPI0008438ECE|nr:uncharacterized protein LOC123042840 [Triticum aestivum]